MFSNIVEIVGDEPCSVNTAMTCSKNKQHEHVA